MTVTFPSAEDYLIAVQQPQAFEIPTLRSATFSMHPQWDIPMVTSGSAAVVFRAAVDGSDSALRFFTHGSADQARYGAIGRHVTDRGLTAHVAQATWRSDAIRIRGATWPVVEMEWVEGRTLDAYVGDLVEQGDTASLGLLAREWRRLVGQLQAAEFAHGDLQHGNVLVDTSGHLRLVDLDGSWIPALAGQGEPGESGHPNYQRRDRMWGPWMDTFPGLVIYTALLGLAALPPKVEAHWIDDKIIFSERDLISSVHTPAWTLLEALPDSRVCHALALLRRCCAPGWQAAGSLDDLLEGEPGSAATRTGTVAVGTPWWELTAPETATAPPTLPRPKITQSDLQPPHLTPPRTVHSKSWTPHLPPVPQAPQAPQPSKAPSLAATVLLMLWFGLVAAAVVYTVLTSIGAGDASVVAAAISGIVVACGVLAVRTP